MRCSRLIRALAGVLLLLAACAAAPAIVDAAPAYRAHTQATGTINWGNGDVTLARPAGTQNTDLLIATFRASATWNVTDVQWATSYGWTLLHDNGDAGKTYYRLAGSPTSYTLFSWGSATFPLETYAATVVAFSGVDTSAPLSSIGASSTGSGTSAALPSTTATRDDSLRYSVTTVGSATGTTFSAGITENHDVSGSSLGIAGATEVVNSGTVPARTASWGASQSWVAHSFVIQGTPAAPTVTGLAPATGPAAGGTSVIITGTNLSGASAVTFGGANASSYTVDSATQITATAPAGAAGTADVRVTTAGGQSANTAADNYTYVAAPTVTNLAPSSGPAAGGTSVVITGTNLTAASAVTFGGVNATGYTVDSATQITATAPAGSGTVDVRVTTVGGQSANTAADNFTYIPAPSVTNLAPASGPTGGGTSVVITGTNLTGATAVTFGGVNATGYTVNSATQITATAPAGSAGTVDVRVTTPGGVSANTAADNYTYVAAPTVTNLSPGSGPAAGGTSVTITGTNLTGASAVTFGGTNASGYTVDSPTQVTATAPAGSGTADVRVTTVGGTSANTGADDFVYIPLPVVSSLAPSSGPTAGATSVTITGTGLTGAMQVQFGGVDATGYTVDSATQITATAPAGSAGTVDVRVTTPGGTSSNTSADNYTYVPAPTVLSVAPAIGPTGGGNTVTITGTNLTGATQVQFGATNATGFTVDSAVQITATAPAGTGTVDVRVTTPGGTSASTIADDYLYDPCSGGTLDVSVPDFSFDPLALNGLDQAGTQDVAVVVGDLTGLGLGWKVQIGTGRFSAGPGRDLPADAARVTGVSASALGGNCSMPDNGITGYPLTLPLDPAKVTIFNAAADTGEGPAALDVDLELDVPANTAADTYTSDWTVDITAAP